MSEHFPRRSRSTIIGILLVTIVLLCIGLIGSVLNNAVLADQNHRLANDYDDAVLINKQLQAALDNLNTSTQHLIDADRALEKACHVATQ